MDELRTLSTSLASAKVGDVILRQTTTTRLIFRPMLIKNDKNPEAAVKGTFVFQRKGPAAPWVDVPVLPLSSLKKEEDYHLALDSKETLKLFNELRDLYLLFEQEGIPLGQTQFIRASNALKDLSGLHERDLQTFLNANVLAGRELIARLMEWAAHSRKLDLIVETLEGLEPDALASLDAAVSVRALKDALDLWHANSTEDSEEFWQQELGRRSFILEQLFAWPCTIIAKKAFVGGKSIHNQGGHIVDFLMTNDLTANVALVEIKTPVTSLTGPEYRAGVPNISSSLAGSIVQVTSYKASLIEHYRDLVNEPGEFEVFDPPCLVIIGSSGSLTTKAKVRTFELFRRQMQGVQVLTFDELFGRITQLIEVLQVAE